MDNQEAIKAFKSCDKIIFKLTGVGEKEYDTTEFIGVVEALEKHDTFTKDKITRLGQELCKQNRPKEDVYNMFEKGVQTMTVALLKMLKEE